MLLLPEDLPVDLGLLATALLHRHLLLVQSCVSRMNLTLNLRVREYFLVKKSIFTLIRKLLLLHNQVVSQTLRNRPLMLSMVQSADQVSSSAFIMRGGGPTVPLRSPL
ncbi:hypothetical protein CMQ_4288 [Grosmannia clavigera kw1407]|uniref:Uncharacterized protein n=1 Tax=Grosmannia clavigera (strain kw1407 / UAMH 11150) TaxID=655863 RepID=F0XV77_GROCL|nr:uncharacterized protein CMQ_4288 [Grosmannia clavigera kw1407]EFW98436.1 hypothetical protein CMQ_4288 [Grosmannia clavigera kw1407]